MRRVSSFLIVFLLAVPLMAANTTYTYDAAGRLIRVDYGLGKGYAYEYDNNGNLVKRTTLAASVPVKRRGVRSASAPSDGKARLPKTITAPR